ncbi:hypothetical protein [Agrobacterium pusense]|uniref:Uncharacterized protein n=1 Tax=Agrobacterium pusense TaxID=648995 RepID=A0AA44EQF1_9HYPH|nr:hypothetical protein [Agrobacterium pusense]NRF12449.1 hypothetical protein [Agrobacterium pusense]NRF23159.1 hypothetical protein [Agrobacterium pusense]
MQSEEPTIIQSLENHLAEYGHTTVGQDIAAAILVIKDLHQKAALSAQVQDVAGWQLVPKDDESRCVADSALPHEMIEAGILVQEQVNDDHCNYVAGETTDWDCGMVAVAIYRAMLAAAPAKQEGGHVTSK